MEDYRTHHHRFLMIWILIKTRVRSLQRRPVRKIDWFLATSFKYRMSRNCLCYSISVDVHATSNYSALQGVTTCVDVMERTEDFSTRHMTREAKHQMTFSDAD